MKRLVIILIVLVFLIAFVGLIRAEVGWLV